MNFKHQKLLYYTILIYTIWIIYVYIHNVHVVDCFKSILFMEHLIIQTFSISQTFSRNQILLRYLVMLMSRNLKMLFIVQVNLKFSRSQLVGAYLFSHLNTYLNLGRPDCVPGILLEAEIKEVRFRSPVSNMGITTIIKSLDFYSVLNFNDKMMMIKIIVIIAVSYKLTFTYSFFITGIIQ